MDKAKIKRTEEQLKKISCMRQDIEQHEASSLTRALLELCDFCEQILYKHLKSLKSVVSTKTRTVISDPFENLSRMELEELAFNIHTPDGVAKSALKELLR
eukprot:TRINITY_DN27163_c0_g1_i1.p2 TRINITY_DN27163_c0_g1~~TRINITY_DN27163_c0_g1_i1.p2  ORF type:complete len:101 (-),score=2.93 TRINITY_DN27163_c0_g1_i1:2-304(-)